MKTSAKVTRVIVALALLLAAPAIVTISTYRTAERVRERSPRLERALAAAADVLSRDSLSCRGAPEPPRLSRNQLREAHEELAEARDDLGMTLFSLHHRGVYQAMEWGLPGTRGLAALHAAQRQLGGYVLDFELRHPICQRVDHLDPERLRAEEQRSSREVAEYGARLAPLVRDLAATRSLLDSDLPVLAALAWAFGVLELVGSVLFVVVLRQEVQAWKARRVARRPGRESNPTARAIRVAAALGLVLLGPAMVIIPTYRAAERLRERHPPLAQALAAALDVLKRDSVSCWAAPAGSQPPSLERLWSARGELVGACDRLGGAAFSTDDEEVFWAMGSGLPGTRGVADSYQVWLALSDVTLAFQERPICQPARGLDRDRLREEEERSAAEVAAYRERLEPFVPRLAAARRALESDLPVLAALAWTLGVIEVVGWALFLVVLRQELRAWKARRASGPASR